MSDEADSEYLEPDSYCFTSETLAELTGLSHGWILQLCRLDQVAHHVVGKRIWFTFDDLRSISERAGRRPGSGHNPPRRGHQ